MKNSAATRFQQSYYLTLSKWLWLLPIVYMAHVAEEYWGGEGFSAYSARMRGVNLSPTRFLALNALGIGLILFGIFMARRFSFQEWLIVLLSALALANGVSHSIRGMTSGAYNPGLATALLVFIPLGLFLILRMRSRLTGAKHLSAVLVGIGVQVVVSVLALSGGR